MKSLNFIGGEGVDVLSECWAFNFKYDATKKLVEEEYDKTLTEKQWDAWCCVIEEQLATDIKGGYVKVKVAEVRAEPATSTETDTEVISRNTQTVPEIK